MSSKFRKFFAANTLFLGVVYVAYTAVAERRNQKLYKSTTVFKEAMETLKSHRGATHFLGEFIEDGHLNVLEEDKSDDKTTYHVKVEVKGTVGKGNMHFWLSRKDDETEAVLNRIELNLMNMKKRLLILDKNRLAEVRVHES